MGKKDQKIADLERDIELSEETIGTLRETLNLANDHLRLERENSSNLKKELEEAQCMSNEFKEYHRHALIELDSMIEDLGKLKAAFDIKTKDYDYLILQKEKLEAINRGLDKKNASLNFEVDALKFIDGTSKTRSVETNSNIKFTPLLESSHLKTLENIKLFLYISFTLSYITFLIWYNLCK